MNITLKSIKVCKFASQETLCFEANIYIDGKKVGFVSNQGHGGSNMYHFTDRDVEKAFHLHCDSQLSQYGIAGMVYGDADELVGRLLDEHEGNKQYKTWCRAKVMFRLKGDKAGEWRAVSYKGVRKLTSELLAKARAQLVSRHGNSIEEVLNDRFAA